MNTWRVSRDVIGLDASIKSNFSFLPHVPSQRAHTSIFFFLFTINHICRIHPAHSTSRPGVWASTWQLRYDSQKRHTDFSYLLHLFSFFITVRWEVIYSNAGIRLFFRKPFHLGAPVPFSTGEPRLFLFLHQHQPPELKDFSASKPKWDVTSLCFLFLGFFGFSVWVALAY